MLLPLWRFVLLTISYQLVLDLLVNTPKHASEKGNHDSVLHLWIATLVAITCWWLSCNRKLLQLPKALKLRHISVSWEKWKSFSVFSSMLDATELTWTSVGYSVACTFMIIVTWFETPILFDWPPLAEKLFIGFSGVVVAPLCVAFNVVRPCPNWDRLSVRVHQLAFSGKLRRSICAGNVFQAHMTSNLCYVCLDCSFSGNWYHFYPFPLGDGFDFEHQLRKNVWK